MKKKEKKNNDIYNDWLYNLVRPIIRFIVLIVMNPKVIHKKRIPKKGGYLYAGTHVSKFDWIALGVTTLKPVHYLAKKELFDSRFGWFVKKLGMICVDRKKKNNGSKEEAVKALNAGKVVGLFPEGTINKTDDYIMPFKYGAVDIAYKSGAPIVPFAIVNKPKPFNFKTKIIVGKPYYVKSDDIKKENEILEKKVIELIKEGRSMKKEKKKETHKVAYKIYKAILAFAFYVYYRPKIVNKKVIPKDGPIIVCGNHIHLFDQCLPIIATKRMLHYMAKKEYFDGKYAWFFRSAGCISVNRQIHDSDAKSQALEVLNNGWALGIFPEGTRNKTDEPLLPFKMGAVSMAQKTGATLVPFAITGKYKFWNNKLKVTFLEPIKVSKDDDLKEVNERLRNSILEVVLQDETKNK